MNKIKKNIILKRDYNREKVFDRITKLRKDGYFIEAFLFEFSIIENILIRIIKQYGKTSEDILVKKKLKFDFKELCNKDLNQMTFGKLIHYLKIFNDDDLLIKKLKPSELNINICKESSDVCAIVWIQIDADMTEPTYMRKILETDVLDTLNLSEKFSRQIAGVQSPLINDNGKIRSFGISLDNDKTRKTRSKILDKFRETGIYYLFGSNLDEVSSSIKHLSEI